MKRCPVCNSRKFYGSKKLGWKCRNCGFENIPTSLMQKAKCDGGITESGISSQTHHYSSLDWQNSTKDLSINDSLISSPLFQEIHDLHDNAWKFRIIKDVSVDWQMQKGFDGSIQRSEFNGHKIAKTKNWLIIFKNGRNKVPLKDLYMTSNTILQGIVETAKEIARCYNFEIDSTPLLFSRNRPEVKTPFLSANNFYEEEAKAVYPLPSPIELHGKNAVPNAINLSSALVELNNYIKLEIQNKVLHQNVLNDMSLTLKDIRNNVSRPVGFFERIKKVIRWK